MDGLRGIAVLLVFLVHFESSGSHWISPSMHGVARLVHKVGTTGVDLFFLISGYLIYKSLVSGRPRSGYEYLVNRIRRIYPTFTALLLVYVAISIIVPQRSKLPPNLLDGITYVAANWLLLPGIFPIVPIMAVAWSLSYEMAFYLLAPLIVRAGLLREKSADLRLKILLVAALALSIVFRVFPEYSRMLGFLFGMIACDWHLSGLRVPPRAFIGLLATGGLAGIAFGPGAFWRTAFTLCAYFPLLLAVTGRPAGGWLKWFLDRPTLRWLGNISYSYYLTHGLVLNIVMATVFRPRPGQDLTFSPVVFFTSLAATFAGAAIVFLAIEQRYLLRTPRPAEKALLGRAAAVEA